MSTGPDRPSGLGGQAHSPTVCIQPPHQPCTELLQETLLQHGVPPAADTSPAAAQQHGVPPAALLSQCNLGSKFAKAGGSDGQRCPEVGVCLQGATALPGKADTKLLAPAAPTPSLIDRINTDVSGCLIHPLRAELLLKGRRAAMRGELDSLSWQCRGRQTQNQLLLHRSGWTQPHRSSSLTAWGWGP